MNLLVDMLVAVNRLFPGPRIYGHESREAYSRWGYEVGASVFREHFGAEVLRGARVLDIGCGAGGKTVWYAEAGAEHVVGVIMPCHSDPLDGEHARAAAHALPVRDLPFDGSASVRS